MNMKKMKKFFTLSRRAEGFTLVELIVVIAILAILGGVAVPAYSGYVKKANMQADMTLISEIEHALELAGYSGTFNDGEGGYLILSPNGEVVVDGSNLEKALAATFGSSYGDTLKLKHDGWEVRSMLNDLDYDDAMAVKSSSYYDNSGKLMAQVEDITRAATSILKNEDFKDTNTATIKGLFSKNEDDPYLDTVAGQYGYEKFDAVPDGEKANLLVLAVAQDVSAAQNDENHELSPASDLIYDFALYNAYASSGNDDAFTASYNAFVETINDTDDVDVIADAFNTLKAAANSNKGFETYKTGQGTTDVRAFESMMTGLTNAAKGEGDGIKAGLSDSTFYTQGMGNGLFNDYLNAVSAMAATPDGVISNILSALQYEAKGCIVIWYSMIGNKLFIDKSI